MSCVYESEITGGDRYQVELLQTSNTLEGTNTFVLLATQWATKRENVTNEHLILGDINVYVYAYITINP